MVPQPVVNWKPLGELLVEHRLLTVDQLDDALEEQLQTGKRLGAILVERRIIASAVLTTVLAEQIGFEFETQDGFGSGLFSRIALLNGSSRLGVRDEGESARHPGELELVPAPERTDPAVPIDPISLDPISLDALLVELDQLRHELTAERELRRLLEAELEQLRSTPARRRKANPPSKGAPEVETTAKATPAAKASKPKAKGGTKASGAKASRAKAAKARTAKSAGVAEAGAAKPSTRKAIARKPSATKKRRAA